MLHSIARKLTRPEEASREMQDYLAAKFPTFLTDTTPWEKEGNTWERYKRDHPPERA